MKVLVLVNTLLHVGCEYVCDEDGLFGGSAMAEGAVILFKKVLRSGLRNFVHRPDDGVLVTGEVSIISRALYQNRYQWRYRG